MPGSSEMAMRGRIGAHVTHLRYGGLELTAAARAKYRASFLDGHSCKVCPPIEIDPGLPLPERERQAVHLRKLHFARLALASARKRSGKAVRRVA